LVWVRNKPAEEGEAWLLEILCFKGVEGKQLRKSSTNRLEKIMGRMTVTSERQTLIRAHKKRAGSIGSESKPGSNRYSGKKYGGGKKK